MIRDAYLFVALVALANCSQPTGQTESSQTEVIIRVPEGTPEVYMTGSLEALGPWIPDAMPLNGEGRERRGVIEIPVGHELEYKFTLGRWDAEAVDENNFSLGNFVHPAREDGPIRHTLEGFKDTEAAIASPAAGGVIGTLTYWQDVRSEHLTEARHVTIWTPPGYDDDTGKHYRVIYMSDGQNLFDPRIANTGIDWGVDEAMMRVAAEAGTDPAIVVATWSTSARGPEYSPWHDAHKYATFVREDLMPRINTNYRTLTNPESTFHIGSSMGGLLSFYLVTNHPDMFSACGCVSTHFPLSAAMVEQYFHGQSGEGADETPFVVKDIEAGLALPASVRYWFDYGTLGLDADYGPSHQIVGDWLSASGLVEGDDYVIREYEGADHNEAAWRARLDDVLTFLLVPEASE